MTTTTSFRWPEGKRAALSLSFDDARATQLDPGAKIMDAHGVKGTFYLSLPTLKQRVPEWRHAGENGHELGNHSVQHPCSGNFRWAQKNALEDYSLARMEAEFTAANEIIHDLTGVTPRTFAFPCGQKFVGRGTRTQSYVPLVAKHFLAGRGFRDESDNDPLFCDLAQVYGMDADCATFAQLQIELDAACKNNGWLVLVAHEVGDTGQRQMLSTKTLDEVCRFASDPANGIWIDTIGAVAQYIRDNRPNPDV